MLSNKLSDLPTIRRVMGALLLLVVIALAIFNGYIVLRLLSSKGQFDDLYPTLVIHFTASILAAAHCYEMLTGKKTLYLGAIQAAGWIIFLISVSDWGTKISTSYVVGSPVLRMSEFLSVVWIIVVFTSMFIGVNDTIMFILEKFEEADDS